MPIDPLPIDATHAALATLRSPATIRARCNHILAAVLAGESTHFRVDLSRLDDAADRVAAVTRRRYPDLRVPYHSRWRHFEAGGIDRHGPLRARLAAASGRHGGSGSDGSDRREVTRALIDLAVVSVLLDAGAGAAWRYREAATGVVIGRSEGLAVASLVGFESGLFSSRPGRPLQVDAMALRTLTEADLAQLFQVGDANPLVGIAGRTRLLNALGAALAANPHWFGDDGRPGGLVDALVGAPGTGDASAPGGTGNGKGGGTGGTGDMNGQRPRVTATAILDALLQGLASIWPSGQQLAGRPLGDCWPHRLASPSGATGLDAGWVPFHKLSQWLTYSLLEPFEWGGIVVDGLDALTGLPEYRNGGLLIDCGVLLLRDPAAAARPQPVGSELVIEWRALTVALLDQVADRVRARLGQAGQAEARRSEGRQADGSQAAAGQASGDPLPLAAILEGGTWAAGRELAAERRGGEPPLAIASDGTVF
ncbi:MAG: URC4/urg3 family protein [Lautropia sp.]